MNEAPQTKENSKTAHKILTVIGVFLCVILIPVLVINCVLIVKSQFNKESVPDIGGVFPLIVLTDSMSPEIEGGDLIICRTTKAEEVNAGDVIAFFDPAGNGTSIVTHRVVEITTDKDGNPAWKTKGDANNTDDEEPVPFDNLVGIWSGIRLAGLGNAAMFMQTSTGLIVCVVVPLVALVAYDILRRRRFEKENEKDTEELLKELEELRRLKAEKEEKQKEDQNASPKEASLQESGTASEGKQAP